jgi:plasmid stabilization system protein ParE
VISSVSSDAELELIDGALFYAREANAELGLAFIAEFERSLGVLLDYPRLGPVWRGQTRRFPLRRFPYTIIYQLKPDEIRVIALAHQRRKPGYWRGRK